MKTLAVGRHKGQIAHSPKPIIYESQVPGSTKARYLGVRKPGIWEYESQVPGSGVCEWGLRESQVPGSGVWAKARYLGVGFEWGLRGKARYLGVGFGVWGVEFGRASCRSGWLDSYRTALTGLAEAY